MDYSAYFLLFIYFVIPDLDTNVINKQGSFFVIFIYRMMSNLQTLYCNYGGFMIKLSQKFTTNGNLPNADFFFAKKQLKI